MSLAKKTAVPYGLKSSMRTSSIALLAALAPAAAHAAALTMGTRPVTLDGGSITGAGTLSTSGSISGYGTISSLLSGTPSFTANATNGTTYTFSPTFKNGTPGTPITLIGRQNLTSNSFTISGHGSFNFQGVKLTTPTLNASPRT